MFSKSSTYTFETGLKIISKVSFSNGNGFAMIDFYESCDKRHRLSHYGNDYIATLCIKL